MMKTRLILALLLASLLVVLLSPMGGVHAAPQSPDQNPAAEAQAAAVEPSLPATPPVVQIAIGLVMLLFGCLALAPLAQPDDSLRFHSREEHKG